MLLSLSPCYFTNIIPHPTPIFTGCFHNCCSQPCYSQQVEALICGTSVLSPTCFQHSASQSQAPPSFLPHGKNRKITWGPPMLWAQAPQQGLWHLCVCSSAQVGSPLAAMQRRWVRVSSYPDLHQARQALPGLSQPQTTKTQATSSTCPDHRGPTTSPHFQQ